MVWCCIKLFAFKIHETQVHLLALALLAIKPEKHWFMCIISPHHFNSIMSSSLSQKTATKFTLFSINYTTLYPTLYPTTFKTIFQEIIVFTNLFRLQSLFNPYLHVYISNYQPVTSAHHKSRFLGSPLGLP